MVELVDQKVSKTFVFQKTYRFESC